MDKRKMISAALMRKKPDLVLKYARIVNVFTSEIISGDVAVAEGMIVGTGEYSGKKEVDLQGKYVLPGFVNAHVHVESSMVTPEAYAMEELRHGTTTLITDPHEIVNVGGAEAIKDILAAAERSPANYYVMLPSCVPSTPFENSGAVLNAEDLIPFRDNEFVPGLGEMMNSVGVLAGDKDIMAKLDGFEGMIVDGHFPMGTGKALNAYITAGIHTDHESISFEEALEKVRAGLAVLIREGSASRNLDDIVRGIVREGTDISGFAFCTDDKHLADIRRDGTIAYNIRRSIELGLDPIKAIKIATINAARIYGLKRIGAVACGYKADLVVVDELEKMNIVQVYKDGVPFEEIKPPKGKYSDILIDNVNIAPITEEAFYIPERENYSVIGIVNKQIVTKKLTYNNEQLKEGISDGSIRKIAVIERHYKTGNCAAAYIKGYGLRHGAVASTVAHDSHNIVVVGDNDPDMYTAVIRLKSIGGGYVIVGDGKIIGELPLRLGGLMSLKKVDAFIPELDAVIEKAFEMGVNREIDPFITLSFMALPVIPELRITDCGLFDVNKFGFTE